MENRSRLKLSTWSRSSNEVSHEVEVELKFDKQVILKRRSFKYLGSPPPLLDMIEWWLDLHSCIGYTRKCRSDLRDGQDEGNKVEIVRACKEEVWGSSRWDMTHLQLTEGMTLDKKGFREDASHLIFHFAKLHNDITPF
ncbi:hypothetical protein H5410_051100 [Solanum commersonii]|uniref:Uncharacterized protein n=1 Tax=Solanum commersonii TaxID=4109 RepID=A0A9J5WX97_SOLCO|nr:hypothetical protein H5410_051100 [Solanum commersonii]